MDLHPLDEILFYKNMRIKSCFQQGGGVGTKIQDMMHFSEVVVSGRRAKSTLVQSVLK